MSERPILFNTEMVKAILDGRKTCTRRIVKGYIPKNGEFGYTAFTPQNAISCRGTFETNYQEYGEKFFKLPYQKGDVLYVRETWHKYTKRIGNGENCRMAEFFGYKASVKNSEDANEPWKPSIHMPKKAVRIWLKVTAVRVERLQEITIDGIRSEGLSSMAVHAGDMEIALQEWKSLWNSTIKKSDLDTYGWDANPYVWVIEFERYEKPRKWGLRMRLIKDIDLKYRASEYCLSKDEYERFCKIIDAEPTAYDVDKVVEQLEYMKSLYQRLLELKDRDYHKYAFKIEALSDAIEIVKADGIDGKS